MSHRTRLYGGKRYSLFEAYESKKKAKNVCKSLRENSWNCNILERKFPEGTEYYVYRRKRQRRKTR